MAVYESKRGLLCRHPPVSIARMMIWVAIIILINANCGGAAVIVKSNVTNGCISGREEECLIAEDKELELLLMEYSSHVARVLQTAGPDPVTTSTGNPSQHACSGSRGDPYHCNPGKGNKNGECKNRLNRGCY